MANIDVMADEWVNQNLDVVLSNLYASLVVGGEYDNEISRDINTLRGILEDPAHLGDLRFWMAAVYAAIVTGEHTRKIDDIRGQTYEVDLATRVPRIDDGVVDIGVLVAGIPSLADELIGVVASAATIETGVGAVLFGLAAANLLIEASALWQEATTAQIDGITPAPTDLTGVLEILNLILTKANLIPGVYGYAQATNDIFTGTNDPDTNFRLGQRWLNTGGHVQTQYDEGTFLQDYLNAALVAAPLAGLTELAAGGVLGEVTEIDVYRRTGLEITIDDMPARWAQNLGPPTRYRPFGCISYGRLGGYHGLEQLRYLPTVIQPLPAGTESVRIELYGGLTGAYRLIRPILSGS